MRSRLTNQRALRPVIVVLLLLLVAFVWLLRSTYRVPAPGEELTFTELSRFATSGQVTTATLLDEDGRIVGSRCVARSGGQQPTRPAPTPPPGSATPPGPGGVACNGTVSAFHADYPHSDAITQQLIQGITRGGAPLTIDRQRGGGLAKLFLIGILLLAILATVYALIRMARGTGGSLADIARLGRGTPEQPRRAVATADVTFGDVAAADHPVARLREVSEYLADPTKFEGYGDVVPGGVLLSGPPGCGKTLLARAVAGEAKAAFLSVSAAEGMRDQFEHARKVAPAVVFVDELDALDQSAVNQLLAEIDETAASTGIVVIGATSRPDALDRALVRRGRLDRHVTVSLPDLSGRKAILRLHAQRRLMARNVELGDVAGVTSGLTGADLSQIVDRAAWSARKGGGGEITSDQLAEAVQWVLDGPGSGRLLNPDDRERIAYHHAGHAVVAAAFGQRDHLERVSVLGQGHGLGEDAGPVVLTTEEAEGRLGVAMAGISAEQVRFGTTSTAGDDDIERATGLAREMVGRYGMSSTLGRVPAVDENAGWSERTRQDFEDEVKRLITTAEQRATTVLQDHRPQLDKLAAQLRDAETLGGAPLQALLVTVQDRTSLLRESGAAPETRAPDPG